MTRKYRSMMPKAEWVAPVGLKVGDVAVVLHGNNPKSDSAQFTDLLCGSTEVVEIKKNGTIILANGFRFHPDGYGHARNSACVLSDRHAIERDAAGTPVLINGQAVPAHTRGYRG